MAKFFTGILGRGFLSLSLLGLGLGVGSVATAAEGGMPQLDASTYLSQLFWLVLSFACLFFVMSKVALPRVSEILNLRDSKIRQDLEEAEKLKAEAEALQAKIDSNLAEARNEAHEIIKRAQDKATAAAAKETEKTDANINNLVSEALENIESARAKALKDIDSAVADTAQAIVKNLADLNVSKGDAQKAAQSAAPNQSVKMQ